MINHRINSSANSTALQNESSYSQGFKVFNSSKRDISRKPTDLLKMSLNRTLSKNSLIG